MKRLRSTTILLDCRQKETRVSEEILWNESVRIVELEGGRKRYAFGSDVAYAVGADAFNVYTQLRTDQIPVYHINEELTRHVLKKFNMTSRAKKLYLLDVKEIDEFVQGDDKGVAKTF